MRINRDFIIPAILHFKNDFLKFIDEIHLNQSKQNGALEFKEIYYVQFYHHKVMQSEDESHQRILSLDTLLTESIFTYQDKEKGTLILSKVIYDLLVFLDVSRNKELSNAKFEDYRRRTYETSMTLRHLPVGTDDYRENLQLFWELINEILTTIKENIQVLHHKVDEVAEQYKQLEQGEYQQNIDHLYESTQTLQFRFVQPCLEFINPNNKMAMTENFVQAVDELAEYYRLDSNETLAISIQYKKTAITSYYKDIEKIASRLSAYLYNLSEDRRYFMAIESAFTQLIEGFDGLRHGKQRKRLLNPEMPEIEHFKCFDGLATHTRSYSAKFQRNPDSNKVIQQFRRYYQDIEDKQLVKKQSIEDWLTETESNPVARKAQHQRKNYLMQLISQIEIIDTIDDVHLYVSKFLQQAMLEQENELENQRVVELQKYQLIDTLYGIEFFIPLLDKKNIRQSQKYNFLEDELYFLEYLPLTYQA